MPTSARIVLYFTAAVAAAHAASFPPSMLRTDGRLNDHALHKRSPRSADVLLISADTVSATLNLAWAAPATARFCRVRVVAESLYHRTIYDSGPVESRGNRLEVPRERLALPHASQFHWEVIAGETPGDVAEEAGDGAEWSAPAFFETPPSLLSWDDTEWIGGFNELRGEFSLDLPDGEVVAAARAYVTGVGSFYLSVGGQRVGDHVMDPAFTVYDKTGLFVAFDVTDLLASQGVNVVGGELGSGQWGYLDRWCNLTDLGLAGCRALRLQIVAVGSAGSVRRFVSRASSGSSWVGRQGPIVYDHLWHGEIFDARRLLDGWASLPLSSWPNGTWSPAVALPATAVGALAPQLQPPIRQVESLTAVSALDLGNGSLRFDFGRNIAGFCTLSMGYDEVAAKVTDDAVVSVRMKHTEILGGDGAPFNNYFPGMETYQVFRHSQTCDMPAWYAKEWYECANQTDLVVVNLTASPQVITYTPSFTYHGFRFVDVTVSPPEAAASFSLDITLVAKVARSDLRRTLTVVLPAVAGVPSGTPDLLNRVYGATMAASESQLWGIPTDCPQREKRGWMGDAHMSSDGLMRHYDSLEFHAQFIKSMRDDQLKGCSSVVDTPGNYQHCNGETDPEAIQLMDGSIPDVVPYSTGPYGSFPGSPVWASGYVVISRNLLRRFGPDSLPVLAELYDGLASFMAYLSRTVDPDTGLLLTDGLGDWVPPGGNDQMTTPAPPVSAFYYLLDLSYMEEIARVLGKNADADAFAATLATGRASFHAAFWSGKGKGYCYSSAEPRLRPSFAQTCTALALYIGAPPTPEAATEAVQALVADILVRGTHLNVGIVGMTFMFEVLQRFGYDSVGLDFLMRDDYPSLGFMVVGDATTLWEGWEGNATTISDFGTSRNHIMFGGGVLSWVPTALAGLEVGFDIGNGLGMVVTVKPCAAAVMTLGSGSATHSSGATLAWNFTTAALPALADGSMNGRSQAGGEGGSNMVLSLTVPSGASGLIEVPVVVGSPANAVVTSSGAMVWQGGTFVEASAEGFVSAEVATYGNQTSIRFIVLSGTYGAVVVQFSPV